MSLCPICKQSLPSYNIFTNVITYKCYGQKPYPHYAEVDVPSFWHGNYGTSLSGKFPHKYTIVIDNLDIVIVFFERNGTEIIPNMLILCEKNNNEDFFITQDNKILNLLDFENLPKIVKSIRENVAFG